MRRILIAMGTVLACVACGDSPATPTVATVTTTASSSTSPTPAPEPAAVPVPVATAGSVCADREQAVKAYLVTRCPSGMAVCVSQSLIPIVTTLNGQRVYIVDSFSGYRWEDYPSGQCKGTLPSSLH